MEATSSLCAGGPQDQGRERCAPIEEEDGQAFTGLAKATVLMRFRNRPESVTGLLGKATRGGVIHSTRMVADCASSPVTAAPQSPPHKVLIGVSIGRR